MNYFLYGPDTYRSRKKLNEIVDAFVARAGAVADVHRFDAEEEGLGRLKGVLETDSLFVSKKIVVVEHALSDTDDFESVVPVIKKNHDAKDSMLLLWDRGLSAGALKHYKEIEKYTTKTQEFALLQGEPLRRWISVVLPRNL